MIRSSSHRSFDEGGLALASLNHKAALSVARDGARVRGQHAHRHPMESEAKPKRAKGLVPFNVTDLGGNVFVTYAPSGHIPQTEAIAGDGAVAEFSENGALEKTIVGGPLASPWGVAIAPSSFGKLGGDLLVGNFSFQPGVADMINAFNPVTDALVGSIEVNPGANNRPGGLWSIVFGGSKSDGNPNTLFFTDGINGETGGLFGSLTAVPEPSTWAMMLAGFWRTRALGRAAAANVVGDWLTQFRGTAQGRAVPLFQSYRCRHFLARARIKALAAG
jgi:uncharacterized protein (TIGR03118 family)